MTQSTALLIVPKSGRASTETGAVRSLTHRTDIRLAESVQHCLRMSGYAPLININVFVVARLAILQGRVPSYYLKQLAQTVALSVPGIDGVRNGLEVCRPT